ECPGLLPTMHHLLQGVAVKCAVIGAISYPARTRAYFAARRIDRCLSAASKTLRVLGAEFACIPVLFLTERGTALYRRSVTEGTPLLSEFTIESIEKNTEVIAFPSYGSSAILVNRQHYMAIGGHHHSFKGHGAEDFELLHRLSSLAPWGERPEDYYSDT